MPRVRRTSFDDDKAAPSTATPKSIYVDDPSFSATPLKISEIPEGTDIGEAVLGATLLGIGIKHQGRQIAAVLNSVKPDGNPLHPNVVVEVARRSAKTTSIWQTLIGRCANRPGYAVVMTAQDGTRARGKFTEMMECLRANDFEGTKNPANRRGTLYFANGTERIVFSNRSEMWVVAPDPGNFRSRAADVIFIDEGGELSPDKAQALMAGALPLQDTRPSAQTIVAGTPNVVECAGILWEFRKAFLDGEPLHGGVVYAIGDEIFADLSDPANPVYDLELLKRVQPGIASGLTTVDIVMSRLKHMGLRKWLHEYMCAWPTNSAASALDIEAWKSCAVPYQERPDKIALAFDCEPDGSCAALVGGWRDALGRLHLEVLTMEAGTDWLPTACKRAQDKYKTAIYYDAIGQNLDLAEKMARAPFNVRTKKFEMRDMIAACARLEKEVKNKNVVHTNQDDLTGAVESALWRPAGRDGRLLARSSAPLASAPDGEDADGAPRPAAPLVASAEALYAWDTTLASTGSRRRLRTAEQIIAERAERARASA